MHNEIVTAEAQQKNKIELILTKYVNPNNNKVQFNATLESDKNEMVQYKVL